MDCMKTSKYSQLDEREKRLIRARSQRYYERNKARIAKQQYLKKMPSIANPRASTLERHGIVL